MARGKYRGGHPTGKRHFSSDLGQDEAARKKKLDGEESDSDEEEEEEEEEEEVVKAASGTAGLIETANLNAAPAPKGLKPGEVGEAAPVELTRREREQIEKQRAEALHWKMTEQGKTAEAQVDLARLALVRKQREEAAAAKAAAAATAAAAKSAPKAAAAPKGGKK